jgi:hypothetical protein
MGSPWAAPTGATTTGSGLPPQPSPGPPLAAPPPPVAGPLPPVGPPPRPPRRGGRWGLVAGVAAIVVFAMAGTAAVTYAAAHNPSASAPVKPASPEPSPVPQPQHSAADQAAAKERVCQVFDESTRGQQGQGGMLNNGQLNVPRMLRTLNGVLGVEHALSPATPPDVAAVARKYIDTSLKLTTATMDNVPTEEGNRLNDVANDAIFAFADVCGLPH